MDFVHDQLQNARMFPVLTVIDRWRRECVALHTDFALTGRSVVEALQKVAVNRELPHATAVDHGTGFTSKTLNKWCCQRGAKLDFIRPGKPTGNGLIESFNGRLSDACLNVNELASLDHVQATLDSRREDYNHYRSHGSLGNLTPREYQRSENRPRGIKPLFKIVRKSDRVYSVR